MCTCATVDQDQPEMHLAYFSTADAIALNYKPEVITEHHAFSDCHL